MKFRYIAGQIALASLVGALATGCCKKDEKKEDAAAKKDDGDKKEGDDKKEADAKKGGDDKKKKEEKDEEEELPPDTPPDKDPPAEEPTISRDNVKFPHAHVQFDAPHGWVKKHILGWTIFQPKDRLATLGFVTFTKPNESTRRIGQINRVLGLKRMYWSKREGGTVGKGGYTARGGKGRCQFKSGSTSCFAWYRTVNTKTPEQLLIVYTVSLPKGSKLHRKEAETSVKSLRPL